MPRNGAEGLSASAEEELHYEAVSASVHDRAESIERRRQNPLVRLLGRVAKIAAYGAVGSAMAVKALMVADVASGEMKYQSNSTIVEFVNGVSNLSADSEVWFVFPGLGQVDSRKPAEQFVEANHKAGENEAVAWIQYKNQGFDEPDAEHNGHRDIDILEAFIEQHDVKRIGIVGISMGTPTALEWFRQIADEARAEGRDVPWQIEDIVAYSSPFDSEDPWKSKLLHQAAGSDYPGGLGTKFFYNADLHAIFDKYSPTEVRQRALDEALKKTFNKTPPKLYTSQIKLLDKVNLNSWRNYDDLMTDDVTFTYLIGELEDDTLDAAQAAHKYFVVFAVAIGATWRLVEVVGAGHADTARSASAMTQVFEDEVATRPHQTTPA